MSWFKVDREIFNNRMWKNRAEFDLFFWIVGHAVHREQPIEYGEIKVRRGQYLRSYRKLQEDLSEIVNNKDTTPSLATIKRNVDKLVKCERLTILETPLGTLFTVINYEKYQGNHIKNELFGYPKDDENTGLETPLETGLETGLKQPRNNNKKDNKDKNIYVDQLFNEFWHQYPKKVSKKKAHREFQKIENLTKEKLGAILQALEKQKLSNQWQQDNGLYIPNPATWIYQEKWEDEVIIPVSTFNNTNQLIIQQRD